ncbi:hypothetical protein GH5_06926 [Leishmania sp. Ghana 2012 LV757]|uniref:hypothetical protein n=1 Tax=Leishmania sp. Ghana 2012 LV757 TaxID=2803181 RepID=UPI001B586077|nr:hypothetical protein GH5_06926 [Leishmania sp. Ghana 2012 LV757]
MPSLAKPSQKGRGKKRSGKKPAKIVPDPDAAYRQQLNEIVYIPKMVREKALDAYGTAADLAITACAVDTLLPQRGVYRESPISMINVPNIFCSLGLCLTDDQFDQVTAMIAQKAAHISLGNGAGSQLEQIRLPGVYADREKLHGLLVELLHTRVLAYDPQVLPCPHPRFPDRVSSVVYRSTESDIRSCFNTIWEASGRMVLVTPSGANTRCVAVEQLEELLRSAQTKGGATQALTQKELQDLYFFAKDVKHDVLKEDAFLSSFIHFQ